MSSQTQSSQSTIDFSGILCSCGEPAKELISHSVANPNRPFFKCEKKFKDSNEGCRFFKWKDEISGPGALAFPLDPSTSARNTPMSSSLKRQRSENASHVGFSAPNTALDTPTKRQRRSPDRSSLVYPSEIDSDSDDVMDPPKLSFKRNNFEDDSPGESSKPKTFSFSPVRAPYNATANSVPFTPPSGLHNSTPYSTRGTPSSPTRPEPVTPKYSLQSPSTNTPSTIAGTPSHQIVSTIQDSLQTLSEVIDKQEKQLAITERQKRAFGLSAEAKRKRIEELEEQNRELKEQNASLLQEIHRLQSRNR